MLVTSENPLIAKGFLGLEVPKVVFVLAKNVWSIQVNKRDL